MLHLTHLSLYPGEKPPLISWLWGLGGGAQGPYGDFGKAKKIFLLPRFIARTLGCPSSTPVTVPTQLSTVTHISTPVTISNQLSAVTHISTPVTALTQLSALTHISTPATVPTELSAVTHISTPVTVPTQLSAVTHISLSLDRTECL